jgi:hypothetical protein
MKQHFCLMVAALLAAAAFWTSPATAKADSAQSQAELNARIEALEMQLQAQADAHKRQIADAQAEHKTQIERMQMELKVRAQAHEQVVAQLQADLKSERNRLEMARDQALLVAKQLEQKLKEVTDQWGAEKKLWLAQMDRLRKGAAPADAEKPSLLVYFPPAFIVVTVPVTPDAAVKPWDFVAIGGELQAAPQARKTGMLKLISRALVAAVNGSVTPPAQGAKVETIQVILSAEDAATMQTTFQVLVGGKFTVLPPADAPPRPQALDLVPKDQPAAPKADEPKTEEKPKAAAPEAAPARLSGKVTKVDNEAKTAMIDVGSKHGVVKGMKFFVYEEATKKYLAMLTIATVGEKSAAGDLSVIRAAVEVGSAVTSQPAEFRQPEAAFTPIG